jgi:hypothetical protein
MDSSVFWSLQVTERLAFWVGHWIVCWIRYMIQGKEVTTVLEQRIDVETTCDKTENNTDNPRTKFTSTS